MTDDYSALMLNQMYGDTTGDEDASTGVVPMSGMQQAAALNGADTESDQEDAYGIPSVTSKDMKRADEHLQSVINDLIARQSKMAERNNPENGPDVATRMALASSGITGAGALQSLRAAAPFARDQAMMYQNQQNSMDQLRLRAAEIEKSNMTRMAVGGMRQRDMLAGKGLMFDPQTGKIVANPEASLALAKNAENVERAKMKARGIDIFANPAADSSPDSSLPHAQAIMMAESGGNVNVKPGDGGKAIGPMQLHKAAADEVGVTDRTDPAQNIEGGQKYLDKYTKLYEDQGKENPKLWATVAYKDGPGYAAKWDGNIDSLSDGTQKYVAKVNKLMGHSLLNDEVVPGLDDKLKASGLPANITPRIKAMIEGRGPPLTGFGQNSPYGIAFTNKIYELDPNYDAHRYATITDFDTGATSKIIRPLNTSIAHLGTLLDYGAALNNGDVNMVNKAKNAFQSQFGKEAPSTFDAIKPIVANEVVKAIVARGGSETDRAEAAKGLSDAKSFDQLNAVVDAEKKLLAGQMNSMEQTYKAGTGGLTNFQQKYLTPATRKALNPTNTIQFPMTVRNGSKTATVKNADELAEATSEGFK